MLERLRKEVENLRLRALVLERVEEFKLNNIADEDVWFRELVLCVLTANSSFVSAYKVLGYVMEDFLEVLKTRKPSSSPELIKAYQAWSEKYGAL